MSCIETIFRLTKTMTETERKTQVCTNRSCSNKGVEQPINQFWSEDKARYTKTCLSCRERDLARKAPQDKKEEKKEEKADVAESIEKLIEAKKPPKKETKDEEVQCEVVCVAHDVQFNKDENALRDLIEEALVKMRAYVHKEVKIRKDANRYKHIIKRISDITEEL